MPKSLSPAEITPYALTAAQYSDGDADKLTKLGHILSLAHILSPGGPSLEIGTRCGGSALLSLQILDLMYGPFPPPPLFTVDPYGWKPYQTGDAGVIPGCYGDQEYLTAKRLLAPFPNHAHFLMASTDFLLARLRYWQAGQVHDLLDGLTFAFLDGDHDHKTISIELACLLPLKRGKIVVDNVGSDPETLKLPQLADAMIETFPDGAKWAVL